MSTDEYQEFHVCIDVMLCRIYRSFVDEFHVCIDVTQCHICRSRFRRFAKILTFNNTT